MNAKEAYRLSIINAKEKIETDLLLPTCQEHFLSDLSEIIDHISHSINRAVELGAAKCQCQMRNDHLHTIELASSSAVKHFQNLGYEISRCNTQFAYYLSFDISWNK